MFSKVSDKFSLRLCVACVDRAALELVLQPQSPYTGFQHRHAELYSGKTAQVLCQTAEPEAKKAGRACTK